MLIVSKYNEDINWVLSLNIPYTIYNKGNSIDLSLFSNIINVENKGRESETYLRYIIDNYDNLPENIIFCQGNPFEHCADFIDLAQTYFNNEDIVYLSHWIVTEDLNGCPNACGYGMVPMLEKLNIPLNVTNFIFPAGAQFIVNKKLIQNKSLNWWKQSYIEHENNESSPWIFERIWPIIFNHETV